MIMKGTPTRMNPVPWPYLLARRSCDMVSHYSRKGVMVWILWRGTVIVLECIHVSSFTSHNAYDGQLFLSIIRGQMDVILRSVPASNLAAFDTLIDCHPGLK